MEMLWNLGELLGLANEEHDFIEIELLFDPWEIACCEFEQSAS
jgi:hypothetical protein